ncbi:MAG: NifU family protein [Bacteroidota bacterium]
MSRSVNLHIEGVPNPNAMKFVLENGIMVDKPYEFTSLKGAADAPLARKLLMLRYVDRVLINRNYVTVVKKANQSEAWNKFLMELKMMIQTHLEQNEPIIYLGVEAVHHRRSDEAVIELITDLLDRHIRPAAQEDGGDIVFESYENGILNLSMHGSCHGCPYARQTMKEGVEKVMNNMVPEVKQVISVGNNVL